MEELGTQIMKAKCEKAPGESGVTPEAYKVMSMESKTILLKILCNVYEGRTDPDEWHKALAKCLHKKGDTFDLNNWRAICLKDMSARLMSGIAHERTAYPSDTGTWSENTIRITTRTRMLGRTIHTAVSSRKQERDTTIN